jgi:hypothetical protein
MQMKTFHYRYLNAEGECLGESALQANFGRHTAFFCATCGKIWARIHSDDPFSTWVVDQRPCEEHSPTGVYDWHTIPGSILSSGAVKDLTIMPDWARTLEHLPDAILQRELQAHLNHYDKQNGDSNEKDTTQETHRYYNELKRGDTATLFP